VFFVDLVDAVVKSFNNAGALDFVPAYRAQRRGLIGFLVTISQTIWRPHNGLRIRDG
jgi:hypothetical protein